MKYKVCVSHRGFLLCYNRRESHLEVQDERDIQPYDQADMGALPATGLRRPYQLHSLLQRLVSLTLFMQKYLFFYITLNPELDVCSPQSLLLYMCAQQS